MEQVLNWIHEVGGVNLVVQYDAPKELGVERDKPATVELRNVQLSAVLWTTLRSAGGTDVSLGWEVAQVGTVTVSTRDSLGRELHTRIYDVRELLMNLSR